MTSDVVIYADGGREIVRVDRVGGAAVRTAEYALQQKGDRPYFQAARQLGRGELYMSRVELNRELGEVVEPHQPVVRVASPAFDSSGNVDGVLIVNLDMASFFALVSKPATVGRVAYAANREGDYLLHPDRNREFGFDLGQRYRIQEEFPELAEFLAGAEPAFSGLVEVAGETSLAYARWVPLEPDVPDREIMVASFVPYTALLGQIRAQRNAITLIALALIAAGALAAIVLARIVVRPVSDVTLAAHRLAAGDRDVDVGRWARRRDETGELARAVGTMAAEIQRREQSRLAAQLAALQRSYREIEGLNARLHAVTEAAMAGLMVVDHTGAIVSLNTAASTMFGHEADEMEGKSIASLLAEPYRSEYERDLADDVATGSAGIVGVDREIPGVRKDGSVFPMSFGLREMNVRGSRQFLAVARDITARKEYERAREARFVSELTRSNAELAEFAYVASHDLQEPLRMVASYLQLLSNRYGGKLDSEADEFIAFAIDGATRMKRLINDLLGYSRAGNGALGLEDVDTGAVVERVTGTYAEQIGATGASISVGTLPTVRADAGQLERVFQNLIGNALKYHADRPPLVRVDAKPVDGNWRFSVSDNGIGIDPRFSSKVFEIFKRLHGREQFSGTGIGLAVTKLVVERHGGEIWVEPNEEGGSTFYFNLPGAAVP